MYGGTYKRNNKAHSSNFFCRAKARKITYSECLSVALVIQHAKQIFLILLSSVVSVALPYFFTLSHERYDFRKKVIEQNKMCVLSFSTTFSGVFLILRRIRRDMLCLNFHLQRPLILSLMKFQLFLEIF
jgi:hypothetical protein